MDNVATVRLPRELVERVDEVSRDELRSRSNMVARLVDEGLRLRVETAKTDALLAEALQRRAEREGD